MKTYVSRTQAGSITRLVLAALCMICSTQLIASVPVSGTLTAEHACQAFVSKNKKTNPNHQLLRIGTSYTLLEANKADDPQWYRIRIEGAAPKERWVHKFCGTLLLAGGGSNDGGGSDDGGGVTPIVAGDCPLNNCNDAATQESHLLAISWQPAFCETSAGRSKPECSIDDPAAFQANNFTLHGLWPNKLSQCGINYGYCGSVCSRPSGSMCNYPAVPLSADVRAELAEVMPSVDAGSCLQRHEWWKHGTCSGMDADTYYIVSTALTLEFNQAGPAALMAANVGGSVEVENFLALIDGAFGPDSRKLIELKCRSGNLNEVKIHLPREISANDTLASLIQRMDKSGHSAKDNCGNSFKVDPIGQ